MLVNYFWNMALSRELQLSLGIVEVIMRNQVHEMLVQHTGRRDWYDHMPLGSNETRQIKFAKSEISKTKQADVARGLDPVTPGRVVASQTLGFWTSMLSSHYGSIWTANPTLIQQAFPRLHPSHQNRGYVHGRFNRIRLLRNRVSHHEPIWNGVRLQSGKLVPLMDIYTDILDAIDWTSPTLQASVKAFDRFPGALSGGQAQADAEIRGHLKI